MSSSSSTSHKKTAFSLPFLLTEGGDLCGLSRLLRSLLFTGGKRTRGALGGGRRDRLNEGCIFLGEALPLKGLPVGVDLSDFSNMLLDIGGVPGGSLGL